MTDEQEDAIFRNLGKSPRKLQTQSLSAAEEESSVSSEEPAPVNPKKNLSQKPAFVLHSALSRKANGVPPSIAPFQKHYWPKAETQQQSIKFESRNSENLKSMKI